MPIGKAKPKAKVMEIFKEKKEKEDQQDQNMSMSYVLDTSSNRLYHDKPSTGY